jgi:hypothetical protein
MNLDQTLPIVYAVQKAIHGRGTHGEASGEGWVVLSANSVAASNGRYSDGKATTLRLFGAI